MNCTAIKGLRATKPHFHPETFVFLLAVASTGTKCDCWLISVAKKSLFLWQSKRSLERLQLIGDKLLRSTKYHVLLVVIYWSAAIIFGSGGPETKRNSDRREIKKSLAGGISREILSFISWAKSNLRIAPDRLATVRHWGVSLLFN